MKKRRSALSRISFNELFVETTQLVAQRSSCVKAQQAALLIKDNRIISSKSRLNEKIRFKEFLNISVNSII